MKKYQPIKGVPTPVFCGFDTYMRLPYTKETEDVDFAVVGVPLDLGSPLNIGQRWGPKTIRETSWNCRHYNRELDIEIFEYLSGVDFGDIAVTPGNMEKSIKTIEDELFSLFSSDIVVFSLGGDHSITIPALRAVKRAAGPVALVHFDAHSDAFKDSMGEKVSPGTPIRRVIEENCVIPQRSIQLGIRASYFEKSDIQSTKDLGIEIVFGNDLHEMGMKKAASIIKDRVGDMPVYITFDTDFLDASFVPGTNMPMIEGFSTWEAMSLLRGLKGIDIIGGDVVCINPPYDSRANISAIAAANIIWQMISLRACYVRDKQCG